GAEHVVVTEFDFVGADSVIFVDNGYDAEVEESFESIAYGDVAIAAADVLAGEQDLSALNSVCCEGGLPCGHEQWLADGGAGLESGEIGGAAGEFEAAHAEADGTGTDNDDIEVQFAQGG